ARQSTARSSTLLPRGGRPPRTPVPFLITSVELGTQFALKYLAGGGARQWPGELHRLRALEAGQAFLEGRAEFGVGEPRTTVIDQRGDLGVHRRPPLDDMDPALHQDVSLQKGCV